MASGLENSTPTVDEVLDYANYSPVRDLGNGVKEYQIAQKTGLNADGADVRATLWVVANTRTGKKRVEVRVDGNVVSATPETKASNILRSYAGMAIAEFDAVEVDTEETIETDDGYDPTDDVVEIVRATVRTKTFSYQGGTATIHLDTLTGEEVMWSTWYQLSDNPRVIYGEQQFENQEDAEAYFDELDEQLNAVADPDEPEPDVVVLDDYRGYTVVWRPERGNYTVNGNVFDVPVNANIRFGTTVENVLFDENTTAETWRMRVDYLVDGEPEGGRYLDPKTWGQYVALAETGEGLFSRVDLYGAAYTVDGGKILVLDDRDFLASTTQGSAAIALTVNEGYTCKLRIGTNNAFYFVDALGYEKDFGGVLVEKDNIVYINTPSGPLSVEQPDTEAEIIDALDDGVFAREELLGGNREIDLIEVSMVAGDSLEIDLDDQFAPAAFRLVLNGQVVSVENPSNVNDEVFLEVVGATYLPPTTQPPTLPEDPIIEDDDDEPMFNSRTLLIAAIGIVAIAVFWTLFTKVVEDDE